MSTKKGSSEQLLGIFLGIFLMTTPAIFICKSPRISQLALESKVRTLIILLET